MRIHLIGIGGIGVSALAQYYLSKGHEVSGSDLGRSEITDFVKEKGVKVFIGNFAKNINKDLDLVVYSPAVKENNKELKQVKKFKIKTISYPEALGELTKEYYTIAVAGAHGKSTTTAMLGLALEKAGLDPTVIVGTKVKEFGNSNFRAGKSKLLVIEACEYDSSFLFYSPKIIVVTNIDKEHLDYFKTFERVKKAFEKFIKKLPANGHLVQNMSLENPDALKIKKVLQIPGRHNVLNALAVLQVTRILEIPDEITFEALSEFKGTWRRFEIKPGKADDKKITVVSDYAHHPTEIYATLQAAREKYKQDKIWCVFQPHQHQRTYYLFKDFVKILRQAQDDHFVDKIIVTDIYDVAGRETKKINKNTSSEKLVKKINKENVVYMRLDKIEKYLKENIGVGDLSRHEADVLIIMGAGDIYKLAEKF